MADQEMINRVAKSIADYWMDFGFTVDEPNKKLAQAVIQAMREPTEKMLEPVTNADGFFKIADPKQAYQAMIDAVLND